MFVEVNTGNGMENKETLERWASDYLNETLARFNQDITRVQVQLSDENSGKGGAADKRCMLEARDEAFRGASQKLIHAIEHALGKLDRKQHRDRETIRKDASITE
jgi:hypothetical protein